MEDYCFVIQPFDRGKFDKRYYDVIKPALKSAGMNAYRVDNDPTSTILIETIEERIKNSRFCLADITTDNPNVWYEVGYTIASDISIILICSSERTTPFPFDIRHRNIINYKTDSPSDYDTLKEDIIRKSQAILSTPNKRKPSFDVRMDEGGLNYQEIALLGSILANQDTPLDGVSAWTIKQDMKNYGLNEIAFNLAARKLLSKGLLEIKEEHDYNGNECVAYEITDKGNQWIINNEEKFSTEVVEDEQFEISNENDIPF